MATEPTGQPAVAPPPSERVPAPSSPPGVTAWAGGEREAEVAALRAAAEAANARVGELEAELARCAAALAAAERTIAELRLAVTADAASVEQAVAAAREEQAAALAAADRTIAGLRSELAAARAAASTSALPVGADDLQAVKGIGPKLAAKLVALGITSFRQLAELGPDDLAPLAELVGVPLKRIERDGWVESARALVARGSSSGGPPPSDGGDVAARTPPPPSPEGARGA